MALVQQGFELHVTLTDSGGKSSTLKYVFVDNTYAGAAADITEILTAISTITYSEVKGYALVERYIEDAFALPTEGHNSERATVTLQIAGEPLKSVTIHVPNPVDGVFVGPPGTTQFNVVDGNDLALQAYINLWQETGAILTISDGEFVADDNPVLSGKRTHRQSSFG